MAAYIHSGKFICGGSLITTKLIVTAAHCVQSKFESQPKRAEDSNFVLGKYNLASLTETNTQSKGVSQLIIHPDWRSNDESYDADITMVVLSGPVTFTKFVKPICLWTKTTSYADIIGQKGVVAGWGKTEYDEISTDAPLWTELPIVDQVTCLLSNTAFNSITSNRTFCAGKTADKRGPCNGDSGKQKLTLK